MRTPPQTDRLSEYFAYLRSVSPSALRVWAAPGEAELFAAVEGALWDAVKRMEASAKQHRALQQQPGFPRLLVQLLTSASIYANTGETREGCTDVGVRHPAEPAYATLGECLVYESGERHRAACRRLLDRCASGRPARGFCLEFFVDPGMPEKLQALRAELAAEKPFDQVDAPADHPEIDGAFVTAHRLPRGAVVELLHLGCNLS